MNVARVSIRNNIAQATDCQPITSGTIGATVSFSFDNTWDGYNKTYVWRAGDVTKDDTTASGVVPAEVLAEPGVVLRVGVYGVKGDLATPTIWANLGKILPGADPSGDETTDPTLPVWAQVQTDIDRLEQASAQAQVANAEAQAAREAAEDAASEAQAKVAELFGTSTVNVKALGAVGDGETDDSDVIQRAINGYRNIIIPAGTYRVHGLTLRSGVRIIGEGATLKIVGGLDFGARSYEPTIFRGTHVTDIEISGLHFDGGAKAYFDSGHDTVPLHSNDGILLQYADDITIHDCTFNNFKGRGIYGNVDYKTDPDAYCVHGLHVYDCDFNDQPLPFKVVTLNGSETYPDGTKVAKGTYHIYPTSLCIQVTQSGAGASNQDIVIERCRVHKSPNYGISIYPTTERVTIRDCEIRDCGLYTSEDANEEGTGYIDYGYYRQEVTGDAKGDHGVGGCIKLNGVRDAVIERCRLYGARGSNISIHSDTSGGWKASDNIRITGNTIGGNQEQRRTGHGVYAEAGTNVEIAGNTITDQVGKGLKHFVWGTALQEVFCIVANLPAVVAGNVIRNGNTAVVIYSGRVLDNDISAVKNGVSAVATSTRAVADLAIRGNRMEAAGTGWDMGVMLDNAAGVVVENNSFALFTQGVRSQTNASDVTIRWNGFGGCTRGVCSVKNKSTTTGHDKVNIYGNTFVSVRGPVIWEDASTSPVGTFVPTNSKVDFVDVT